MNANLNLDLNNVESPISKLAGEQFQDPEAVIRFDGSDLMPAEVGSGFVLVRDDRVDRRGQGHPGGSRRH